MGQNLPIQVGGRVALDLVNTAEGRGSDEYLEFLPEYSSFAAWAGQNAELMPVPERTLKKLATADPDGAREVLHRVREVREAMHGVLLAAIGERRVASADLGVVNTTLARATGHHLLERAPGGGIRDGWAAGLTDAERLESPLWPVVIDAWDILTTSLITQVKECPGHGCGWLFLDTSRSGTRRWCDMRTCGNRAKVASHYARSKDGTGS